jgi:hypothetical protein
MKNFIELLHEFYLTICIKYNIAYAIGTKKIKYVSTLLITNVASALAHHLVVGVLEEKIRINFY